MRSRPKLEVVYWPRGPRPGEKLQLEARLFGVTQTPIDKVTFRFTGREERLHAMQGKTSVPIVHTYFELEAEAGKTLLRKGQKLVLPFHFELPGGLPPSYRSPVSRIEYALDVGVDIPWWPDLAMRYAVRVWPSPRAPRQKAAAFHATKPRGPQGKELHLELTVNRDNLELGGTLTGAIAATNVEHHAVKRLELAVVLMDRPVGPSAFGPQEIYRSDAIRVDENAPRAGATYPFVLRLPTGLPPSFKSRHIWVAWYLEARAVIRFGKDVVLMSALEVSPPFELDAPAKAAREKTSAPRTAPLGRERRALVWAAVARMTGLHSDPEGETMTGKVGDIGLTVMLELRGAALYSVAMLTWPNLQLDVDVAERRWRDAFSAGVPLGDEAFDKRFTVRGRDARQLQALLNAGVRAQLMDFERAAVDDEGAEMRDPGNGYTVDGLEPFVRRTVALAAALGTAVEHLPAPSVLAADADAWRALAAKLGGRFHPGGFSIRGAQYREAPVELTTHFDEAGSPQATVARALLSGPRAPNAEAQRVMASLASECQGLRIAADAVEATLPSPLAEPSRAESLWRALARVVKALG